LKAGLRGRTSRYPPAGEASPFWRPSPAGTTASCPGTRVEGVCDKGSSAVALSSGSPAVPDFAGSGSGDEGIQPVLRVNFRVEDRQPFRRGRAQQARVRGQQHEIIP
jgi:hypothetical protein